MIGVRTIRRAGVPLLAALVLTALAVLPKGGPSFSAFACPAGYHVASAEERGLSLADFASGRDAQTICINDKHPEPAREIEAMSAQRTAMQSAPYGIVQAGAFTRALGQRARMLATGQSPENSHRWGPATPNGVLQAGDDGYTSINGLGLVELAGRITSFDYIPSSDRFFPDTLLASVSYGGVWASNSTASNWVSIGDSLPSQAVGAVAYTPWGGGTVIAVTGDGSFGADSREGAGAYWTTDLGARWRRSAGLPDEAFGFRLAVDKAHPNVVYAATGAGLYRSTNAGRSFTNVRLPTGPCAGKSNRVRPCLLANIVTDVVVIAPGGVTEERGSKVVAAVGWRGGNAVNPDGTVQAPANGLYESATGAPGTFSKIDAIGFVEQDRIGRIELGAATGPNQDHNYLYAVVQDAMLIRGGLPGIDAPGTEPVKELCAQATGELPPLPLPVPCNVSTVLEGVYVSPDFGHTWVLMADAAQLQHAGTGTALAVFAAFGYGPGVQAWYNLWIRPDPTMAAPDGTPTRLLFGLEEVWQNENTEVPQNGPSSFKVVGRYFSGNTCLALQVSPCPTNRDQALIPTTTTHPDQHDAIFIPVAGGSRIVVGNDGGVYTQVAAAGFDFSNANWGIGANRGFNTLLPYDAVRAKDGTIWMGLQDNGTAKIVDIRRRGRLIERGRTIQTIGGDGFFVAVDPNNSNKAYEEYVFGAMAATVDGGKSWSAMSPPITHAQFSNPFVMDPYDSNHLMTAGNEVVETGSGPGTGPEEWAKVFDLGSARRPGSASAVDLPTDAINRMTAIDMVGPAAYVGFCGTCDVLNDGRPFRNGIATNVGGSKPPRRYTSQGWHIARAAGLPNRYITGIAMDPSNRKTVYVSLGGYRRPWTPPNMIDRNSRARGGHIYVSLDAGEHFRDISGNLPDTPVNWITLRGKQVIAATDVGVFASDPAVRCANDGADSCGRFEVLGRGLPMAPVYTVRLSAGDPNLLVAAVYGRGVWLYRFGPTPPSASRVTKPLPTPKFLGRLVAGPFGFETDAEGWRAKTNSDAEEWRRQAPGHESGTAFAVSPYADQAVATLFSPKMRLPVRSNVRVSWFERLDTEECCDFLTVDWSSDGYVWHKLSSRAGQNRDFPSFSRASASFVAPAGDLYIRFRLGSDTLISFPFTGVAIDDVRVER